MVRECAPETLAAAVSDALLSHRLPVQALASEFWSPSWLMGAEFLLDKVRIQPPDEI